MGIKITIFVMRSNFNRLKTSAVQYIPIKGLDEGGLDRAVCTGPGLVQGVLTVHVIH